MPPMPPLLKSGQGRDEAETLDKEAERAEAEAERARAEAADQLRLLVFRVTTRRQTLDLTDSGWVDVVRWSQHADHLVRTAWAARELSAALRYRELRHRNGFPTHAQDTLVAAKTAEYERILSCH